MVYFKAIQKITPTGVSVSGTIDQKTYLKILAWGASAPLAPPGSAYGTTLLQENSICKISFDQKFGKPELTHMPGLPCRSAGAGHFAWSRSSNEKSGAGA